MFSPRSIVNVCSGGVKYQLTSRIAADGGERAPARGRRGRRPDDEQQKEEQDARQPDLPRAGWRARRRAAAARRRRARGRARCAAAAAMPAGGYAGSVNASSAASGWLTTWMSIRVPDPRITFPITEPLRQALPSGTPARAHHDLRDVQRARGVEERVADVLADDLVVARAELGDELPLALEQLRGRRREPVLRNHVDGNELAVHPLRHSRGSPDQALAVGRPGQRDEHPLPRLPGLLDPVPLPVLLEALVHPVGEPGEGELAQRREVAGPEVVGERGIDPLGRVDIAAREPVAQRDRASDRRAGARRPGARPRRGSSPAA